MSFNAIAAPKDIIERIDPHIRGTAWKAQANSTDRADQQQE
jgi:hypothetical protein